MQNYLLLYIVYFSILLLIEAQTNISSNDDTSNVRYTNSGNVVMTITRRLYHPSTRTSHNGHSSISPTPSYTAPPPSYSEATNVKSDSVPESQLHGYINHSAIPDVENVLSGDSLPEFPPPYESIQ